MNHLLKVCFLLISSATVSQNLLDFEHKLSTNHHFDYVFPTDNGFFKVRSKGQYTFVDSSGQIAPGWVWYDFIDNFWDGIAPVKSNNRWGLVNFEGQLLIPLECDSVALTHRYPVIWFQKNKEWGMMNYVTNKVLTPPENYYYYFNPNDGSANWVVQNETGYGVIDTGGHWLAPPNYAWIESGFFPNNCFRFMRNGKMGLMDIHGKEMIEPILDYEFYKYEVRLIKGKFWGLQNELWGLLDIEGQWVIPPIYKSVRDASVRGTWVNTQSGLWAYVDNAGKFLIPPVPIDNPYASSVKNNLAIINQKGKCGLMDSTGLWVIPPQYKGIGPITDQLFFVSCDDGKYMCMRSDGKMVVPPNKMHPLPNGELLIDRKGTWSFINKQGKWVKKPKLEAIGAFHGNFALAKKKGKWGIIKNTGKWLVSPQYDDAYTDFDFKPDQQNGLCLYIKPQIIGSNFELIANDNDSKLFWLKKNSTWYLTDTTGQIYPRIAMDSAYVTQIICSDIFAIADRTTHTSDIKWQLYKKDGIRISEMQFEKVDTDYQDRCLSYSVKQSGKTGVLDSNGRLIFPCILDEFRPSNLIDGRSMLEYFGETFWVNDHIQIGTRKNNR